MINVEAIKIFAVIKDGKVDKQATMRKFAKDLDLFELLIDVNHARIAFSIATVFDKWRGKIITKDGIVSFAMNELQATPENHNELSKAVNDFITINTGERGSALFGVIRGRGYVRWADYET